MPTHLFFLSITQIFINVPGSVLGLGNRQLNKNTILPSETHRLARKKDR